MTPFYATLAFPVSDFASDDMMAASFAPGPAFAETKPSRVEDRLGLHRNTDPLQALLAPDRRWHCKLGMDVGHLRVAALDFIRTSPVYADEKAWMIVHLESTPEALEISALTQMGQVARPGTRSSRDLLSTVLGSRGLTADLVQVDPVVVRVPSLALSEARGKDDVGLVRWPVSDPVEGRLVDLLVLRSDKAEVSAAFEVPLTRPTPSFVMASSAETMSIIRLRPVRPEHVLRLRTTWLDAFLLELLQSKEVRGLADAVRVRAIDSGGRAWVSLEHDFGRWRTNSAWEVTVDHPMERTIASQMRESLRTDNFLERIREELFQQGESQGVVGFEGWRRGVRT